MNRKTIRFHEAAALAYSSPRLKIHLIIELDVSQRLLKPPLEDLMWGHPESEALGA